MPEQERWIIYNARLLDPTTGYDEIADIGIVDRIFVRPQDVASPSRHFDAAGCMMVPPLIDLHVHFREPGDEEAETIQSGAAAAIRGGFGTVLTMPNTTPPVDNPVLVANQIARTAGISVPKILIAGCVSRNREGRELADLSSMAAAGAVAFTDDGSTIASHLIEKAARITAQLGVPLMDHALDPTKAGKGVLHDGHIARKLNVPGIPSEAEVEVVRRDIAVALSTKAKIHIQHISAADSVKLLRDALAAGASVSAEATPHHIALTEEDAVSCDTNFKMNPPLRSATDREEIQKAVAEGVISAFATDHAPHTAAAKARGLYQAPFGVIGLETAVCVTYTVLVIAGIMSAIEWTRRWTIGPASVLGLQPASLVEGGPADCALIDICKPRKVASRLFASRSMNTPFEGRTLYGWPIAFFKAGRAVWISDDAQGRLRG